MASFFSLLPSLFLSLSWASRSPHSFSYPYSFVLFALSTRSLFSLPLFRSSASLFSMPRDGTSHPTSKRFARHYFESGGHAFARAKSHLRGSPREGHASSHRLVSSSFFLTDGNTRRKPARKDKSQLRRHTKIVRRQRLILLQSRITVSLLQREYLECDGHIEFMHTLADDF